MNESWCTNWFFQTHETEWGRYICNYVLVRLKRFGVSEWPFSEKRFAGDRSTGCRGTSTGNHRSQGSKWGTEWWNRIVEVGPDRSRKWTFPKWLCPTTMLATKLLIYSLPWLFLDDSSHITTLANITFQQIFTCKLFINYALLLFTKQEK